ALRARRGRDASGPRVGAAHLAGTALAREAGPLLLARRCLLLALRRDGARGPASLRARGGPARRRHGAPGRAPFRERLRLARGIRDRDLGSHVRPRPPPRPWHAPRPPPPAPPP